MQLIRPIVAGAQSSGIRANPGKLASYRWARRQRKLNAIVGDTAAIWRWEQAWRTSESVVCYWCHQTKTPRECHADHVMPLVLGGAHDLNNLVVACAQCNLRKRSLSPEAWLKKLAKIGCVA